jgi:hypothetical protein
MKSFNLTEEVVRLFLIQYSDDQNELRTLVHTDLEEIITQHDRLRIRNNNLTLGSFEINSPQNLQKYYFHLSF